MTKQGTANDQAIVLYGIKNCDTMKKARSWLDSHKIDYQFHDYKTQGIDRKHLESWCEQAGWETVLNRAGTTFRKLPDELREGLDQTKAIALMIEQPSMIKRPVLEGFHLLLIGFKPDQYEQSLLG
jgi:arsenate reductase